MFHDNLRKLRENSGYSQKAFADMLSIPVTTYRNYENTLREPSYDILVKICQALNVTTDTLLDTGKSDEKYRNLFFKIKKLSDANLKTLNDLTDFLLLQKN